MAEVLAVQLPDGQPFAHGSLRSSTSHTSFFESSSPFSSAKRNSYSFSDLRSGSLSSSQSSSFHSTPASSLSFETGYDEDEDDEDDDEGLAFPAYYSAAKGLDGGVQANDALPSSPIAPHERPPPSPVDGISAPVATPDPLLPISEDDTAVRIEPSRHVDYLSHEWNEEEIWSSWRHIVTQRKVYGERSRLENASWRTWAKSQFKLRTVSPETLNWLKDCDVTWLYGPLQPASSRPFPQNASEPASQLSKSNSFLHKKPILKKRSMSEIMLQNSLSSSSLVKEAAAAVQAQQAIGSTLERRRPRPIIGRAISDYVTSSIPSRTTSRDPTDSYSSRSTSGLQTPDPSERKHIRFDDKVEQCIAVEVKDGDDDDDDDDFHDGWGHDSSDSSDEGVVMMKRSRKKRPLSRNNSRSSLSGESMTIAKLPSTTLKYRTDSPDVTEQQSTHSLGFWRSTRLSPSPSQETLRPANPTSNFLLPEDDDEPDWDPSGAFDVKGRSTPTPLDHGSNGSALHADKSSESGGLRRTSSGMFMPYDEEEDEPTPPGLIGRVVDTVNTARDIAHVIWNVGWRNS
ncbi:hypothetical protein EJ04DRAFT_356955 [Polyplosphaeria fusca]|uniref:Nitrogen regulatory protein areA GATA-like domain-containing protein n=1 Tax=Polyplosphaeria fusca TaxID=682080 RepID=A0A9P4R4T3_9PLEO|nr:hypothetical protein EJ04DRAFT_356955 [Polyplosphaeria fusca]